MAAAVLILYLFLCVNYATSSDEEWTRIGQPSPNDVIRISIALKQTNRDWLQDTLHAVSDPTSIRYGHYLTLYEIVEHVHAYPEAVAKIKQVFGSIGLSPCFTLGEGFVVIDMPISIAEDLFSAKFYNYKHHNVIRLCSLSYTVPPTLASYVSFISGITTLLTISNPHLSKSNSTDGDVTPHVIDKSYNISGYTSTNSTNSQAVAGFLGQYFSPKDLTDFQQEYKLSQIPIKKIIGENDGQNQGIEANLDVQYITAIGRHVNTWFISVSTRANGNQEDFMTWVLELVNNTDSPWVHSVSYGDYESSIDLAFMERIDEEFMKLGISGRTLLFASGDSGTACSIAKGGRFEPMWPSTSPYVTSVGGTVSMTECWDHGGGGFSNIYPTPSYQTNAVTSYLNSGKVPSNKYFNSSGRAYPDLAVFSINYLIFYLDIPWPVDGTSCATPTTAGIVSLLNDVRLNVGKTTLGFINPLLYGLEGKGFFDIVQGVNNGKIWCKGFTATNGWDATSGWGSPNFGILKEIVAE